MHIVWPSSIQVIMITYDNGEPSGTTQTVANRQKHAASEIGCHFNQLLLISLINIMVYHNIMFVWSMMHVGTENFSAQTTPHFVGWFCWYNSMLWCIYDVCVESCQNGVLNQSSFNRNLIFTCLPYNIAFVLNSYQPTKVYYHISLLKWWLWKQSSDHFVLVRRHSFVLLIHTLICWYSLDIR